MTFRVALVGIGSHAKRNLLPAFAAAKGVELAAIVSRNPQTCKELSHLYHCPVVSSLLELKPIKHIDALYSAAPNSLHAQHGQFALENGWHFFAEKSFAVMNEQWSMLEDLAKRRSLMIAEAFMFRYHDQFLKVRELIRAEAIGSLLHIDVKFGVPHFEKDNVRYNPKLGGGAFFDVGCYTLMASHLLAESEPEQVQGQIFSEQGYQVDTRGVAQVVFANKVAASLAWGFGHSYTNEYTLWGSKGKLHVKRAFSKPADGCFPILFENQKGEKEEIKIEPCNHFVKMLERFAEMARAYNLRKELDEEMRRQKKLLFSSSFSMG